MRPLPLRCPYRFDSTTIVFAALTTLIPILFWSGLSSAEDKKDQRPKVMVAQASLVELADEMRYPAAIVPKRSVPVVAEVEGFVKDLSVRLGDAVTQGQAIVTLANPDPVYHYKPFVVTAPFSGIVTATLIAAGDRVDRGRPLISLADNKSLIVKINITRHDLKFLTLASKGMLTVDEFKWPVQVRALSPMIDISTGTAPCELELLADLTKKSPLPIAGSVGQVTFLLNQRQNIKVPESAIVYRGEVPQLIKIIDQKQAKYQPVKILSSNHGHHELAADGIVAGETYVVESFGYIIDGEDVSLIPNPGT